MVYLKEGMGVWRSGGVLQCQWLPSLIKMVKSKLWTWCSELLHGPLGVLTCHAFTLLILDTDTSYCQQSEGK